MTGVQTCALPISADNVVIGTATIGVGAAGTTLLVQGNARITGILTVGSSSVTLDGNNNQVNVGSGVTITNSGFLIGASNLHSGGLTASSINVSGVGTFASLVVSGNVSIAGTVTYDDVTNVDSIGIVTARSGVRVDAGGLVVTAGVSTFASQIQSTQANNTADGGGQIYPKYRDWETVLISTKMVLLLLHLRQEVLEQG